jgi:hypothetical protein
MSAPCGIRSQRKLFGVVQLLQTAGQALKWRGAEAASPRVVAQAAPVLGGALKQGGHSGGLDRGGQAAIRIEHEHTVSLFLPANAHRLINAARNESCTGSVASFLIPLLGFGKSGPGYSGQILYTDLVGVYGSPHTLSEHGPGPYSTLVFPLAAGFFVFSSFCWFCSVFLFGFLFPFLFSFSVFIFLSFYFSVQK